MTKNTMAAILTLILLSSALSAQEHIIIGWNDLGMHCSNQDFSTLVILPPYNNVRAQVIRVGDATTPPSVVTSDLHVTYEIPGNTYSVGKTNFWDWEDQLFGVSLPPNIGLTGEGLTGDMQAVGNYFHVEGIPITPFVDSDLQNEDPFQLGLLKLFNSSNELLASAQPVVPVSNEINCVGSGCHSSEQDILDEHGDEAGFDPNATPILCATCHASNALGMSGSPGVPSLSEAIHKKHGEYTDDCYKCHPGPNTQCFRGVMQFEHDFVCQDCHGSASEVGESISDGREPWFDEPSCGAPECHGANYAEEQGKLFRESRGHGGLFCSVCHGEPHAIVPSRVDRDNVQYVALQGHAGTLAECAVCHGVTPAGAGPHGLMGGSDCCVGMRGNIDGDPDHNIDISDLVYLITYMFQQGPPPVCDMPDVPGCSEHYYIEADVNGDGICVPDISDLVYLVSYMFQGGPAPVDCNP